jgi:acyl-CoA synthetase (AMP-forming)/AMP-acid ligase II/pimeloyl-ACP methyl ester carboxylesterase
MTNKIICAHHGSPGSSRDFFHLKLKLPHYHFIFRDRVSDPSYDTQTDNSNIQLGYSFGSVHAILSAALNPKTEKIILIAPYLFPETKPGILMSSLFSINAIGRSILSKMGPSKINEMLKKTSHPKEVPSNYLEDAKCYLDPERLKHSILEKDFDTNKLFIALKKLEEKNIPIIIILGDEDQTSHFADHIQPLLEYKNVTVKKISHAGHALLWTHTDFLASLIEETINPKTKFGYFEGVHELNNVAAFLNDHNSKFPGRKILTWVPSEELKKWDGNINTPLPHKSVTVMELDYIVGILTTEFQKCGIKFGDRVILFLPMSLYMYASMFALQKMGAIPTFLDSWARRDQMGVSCQVANPTAMISAHRAFEYLSDVEEIKNIPIKIVALDIPEGTTYSARLEVLMQGKTYSKETPVDKEHTALITFTTGSSGTPKGADRSHRFLAAQHYALNRHLPYCDNDRDLPVFPIFSLNNLAAGVETIIPAIDVGQPSPHDGKILYAQLKSAEVTCTTLSPSLFNGLSQFCLENKLDLNFLKRIVTGGAPISRDDIERMKKVAHNAEILVLYGSTEVEPMAHIEAKEMLKDIKSNDPEIVEPGVNVGHLDDGLKYKFIKIDKEAVYIKNSEDWKSIELPKGSVGELIVAGEHVCEKYFNNEEAFFRAKIRDEKNIVWHRTGDLGMLDAENNLWIVGRVHNAIKRADEWFFPVKAEIILKKFPFVMKAAFLGMPDDKLGMKTIAVFTVKEGQDDIDQYKKEVHRVLTKNKFIVDEVIHTDDIPMDPRHHSKVEYDILRKKLKG